MAEAKAEGNSLKIVWDYDPEHRVQWAAGIVGGLTPGGCLRASFYNELGVMPDQQETAMVQKEDGTNEEQSRYGEDYFATRRICTTVLIPTERLRSFADWFTEHADNYDKLLDDARRKAIREMDREEYRDDTSSSRRDASSS